MKFTILTFLAFLCLYAHPACAQNASEPAQNKPGSCKIDSDCVCLSGSGVPFVGCGDAAQGRTWQMGSYACDKCACFDNACRSHADLVSTATPAGPALLGSYEMTSLPDGPFGNKYWLGNLRLSADSRYSFTPSSSGFADVLKNLRDRFFVRNPEGTYAIKYAPGVTPEMHLEDLPGSARVAVLTFTSGNGKNTRIYAIVVDRAHKSLRFNGPNLPFQMDKGWSSP